MGCRESAVEAMAALYAASASSELLPAGGVCSSLVKDCLGFCRATQLPCDMTGKRHQMLSQYQDFAGGTQRAADSTHRPCVLILGLHCSRCSVGLALLTRMGRRLRQGSLWQS